MINRVRIIGTSGTGKTYVAKKLSKILNISHYDLDEIFWKRKYDQKRTVPEREKLCLELTKKRKWVLEGVYGSWSESSIQKADLVVLLDVNLFLAIWRIIKRYFKRKGTCRESIGNMIYLVNYVRKYKKRSDTASHKTHVELINKHKVEVIVLKNKKDVKEFLKDF
ncbi:hypothetical protein HOF78_03120 [Candidatus Woesearchaeota archaeon]|jgi:adenylate kinase family enzyme|nr:hypothetical protein [Candidatus Woesearchaeota archaeon]MBT6044449.1 hypothetical protein [Candidatus Woesearchaeota archaeon]